MQNAECALISTQITLMLRDFHRLIYFLSVIISCFFCVICVRFYIGTLNPKLKTQNSKLTTKYLILNTPST